MAIEKGVAFPITATDQFSGAFAALKNQVTGLHGDFGRLNGMISTLTAGLGLAGFGAFIKSTIDAHDEVNKLSQKVGIAVGELSTLKYAAQLSDVSTQALSAGVKGLSQRMIEATDSTSKAGQLMKAMGIDIRGGTLPAIENMADVFKTLPDGPTKAALAVEIFGKAGMDMIPLLNQGTEGMRAMRAEAVRLGLAMNEETAAAAEKFNDNLRAVRASSEGLGVTILNSAAPALVRISEDMKEAAVSGGVLAGVLQGMRSAWSELFFGDPEKNRVAQIRKELALLEPMLDEAPALTARVAALNTELRGLLSFDDLGSVKGHAGVAADVSRELEERLKALMGGGEAGKEALRENERLRQLDADGWVRYIEEMKRRDEQELRDQAKRTAEFYEEKDNLRQMDLEGQKWLSQNVVRILEEEGRITKEMRERNLLSTWDEISTRGADFFTNLVTNGREAFESLGESVKQWGRELISLFARRWILQVGAAMTGSVALGAQAQTLGDGSLAGAFLNNFTGLGSLLPGGELGTAVGNFASMGASIFGAGGSLASTIGSVASFLPAIGAAVGVAAMLYNAFNDGPENPNFRWMQGTGGQGAFGGISTEGNYSFDSTGLTRYVGGLDARFARILGPSGSEAVTSALGGYTAAGLRMDGQPAQFAFPEGTDREAAEQLARELLQSRYGTIFAQIDQGIATQIREFAGTSTELQQFIETALGVVEGLSGMGVRGLDITTLQLMQREGEGLGETFNRVAGQWGQFNQLFTSEAERLAGAEKLVTTTFETLGIAVPTTRDEFENLVRGLDLSTESGRSFFQALMQVAPAFDAVANAAQGMLSDFDSVMGRLRGPAYTAGQNRAGLESATREFMAGNAWTQGMDWRYVAEQIATITREDFSAYSTANQRLINQILGYTADLSNAATPVQEFTGYVANASGAVDDYARSLEQARMSLRDWAVDKMLGGNSALSSEEKYAFALQEYQRALGSGDIGYFRDSADALLGIGRDRYASGTEFTDLFNRVMADAESLGGFSLGRDNGTPASIDQMRAELAAELRAANQEIRQVSRDVRDLMMALRETSKEQTTAVRESADSTARAVRGAVESVAR